MQLHILYKFSECNSENITMLRIGTVLRYLCRIKKSKGMTAKRIIIPVGVNLNWCKIHHKGLTVHVIKVLPPSTGQKAPHVSFFL